MTTAPILPPRVYLRRKEVETAVGGRRTLEALEASGALRRVRLPGYSRGHYIRAEVQAALDRHFGR